MEHGNNGARHVLGFIGANKRGADNQAANGRFAKAAGRKARTG